MSRPLSFLSVALALALCLLTVSAGHGKNAMLLQDVSTLIFTKGEMTNARRSSPVPQLSCKGGPCQYAPQSAMCRNIGFDGQDVTWQCEAELPKGVKFGKVEVSCEGHSSRDDEYVLKGSCGLEYNLLGEARFDSEVKEEDSWWNRNVRSTAGKHPQQRSQSWLSWLSGAKDAAGEKYNDAANYAQHQYDRAADYAQHGSHHNSHSKQQQQQQHDSMGVLGLVSYLISTALSMGVKLIAALIIFFVLWRLLRPAASVVQQPAARRPGLFGSLAGMLPLVGSLFGGGANSGYGGNPPPYNPPPYDAAAGSASGYDKRSYYSAAQQQQTQQQPNGGSGLGVLHGLLGGSLLGYFMGQRRGASQQQQQQAYAQQRQQAYPQPGTVHHVHHNAPPAVNPAYARSGQQASRVGGATTRADGTSIEDVSDVRTTETSTAYARTKRR